MAVGGLVVALLVAANAVALRIETEHARREPAVRRAEHASDLAQRLEASLQRMSDTAPVLLGVDLCVSACGTGGTWRGWRR